MTVYIDKRYFNETFFKRDLFSTLMQEDLFSNQVGISIPQKMGSEVLEVSLRFVRRAPYKYDQTMGHSFPFLLCSVEAWAGLNLYFYLPALHL